MIDNYNFYTHLHNYAVWTAARAAQRGFTTTQNISNAIDGTDLAKVAKEKPDYSPGEFDLFHKTTAKRLIDAFKQMKAPEASYGRVAKIISIYLKTALVPPSLVLVFKTRIPCSSSSQSRTSDVA